jgi:ADP-ribose pyrophosphatase YjhB (NUDIX family)
MSKAARAIIVDGNKLLVMYRNKHGSEYFTLVGGQVRDDETLEQGLVREIMEETGITVTAAQLVFVEKHPAPYNEQYIYFCQVAPHGDVKIQEYSEEGQMNKLDANIHEPKWVDVKSFDRIPFRTPQLQDAILKALKIGFPDNPIQL